MKKEFFKVQGRKSNFCQSLGTKIVFYPIKIHGYVQQIALQFLCYNKFHDNCYANSLKIKSSPKCTYRNLFGLDKLHKVGDVKHNLYIINKLKLNKTHQHSIFSYWKTYQHQPLQLALMLQQPLYSPRTSFQIQRLEQMANNLQRGITIS